MTVKEYAAQKNISEAKARKELEFAVVEGTMWKHTTDEMVYRSIRGYSGKLMPCKVTNYYKK